MRPIPYPTARRRHLAPPSRVFPALFSETINKSPQSIKGPLCSPDEFYGANLTRCSPVFFSRLRHLSAAARRRPAASHHLPMDDPVEPPPPKAYTVFPEPRPPTLETKFPLESLLHRRSEEPRRPRSSPASPGAPRESCPHFRTAILHVFLKHLVITGMHHKFRKCTKGVCLLVLHFNVP
ncbi:hypothetical protein GUJ93_ZPchr0002g23625 [Zizania palustris]|uniref:Uncharacterized protein n=1 Tax=Zizania palustris TaxID=103762 RepID=A0A8J5V4D7_ZIZPA|nr:hypothetical protein GUJ93_ZPchr0002g23625 [Zizania palustris]